MDTYLLFMIVMLLSGILWVVESILANIKKNNILMEKINKALEHIKDNT